MLGARYFGGMGFLDRFRRNRPMPEPELDERSEVDGIKYRDLQILGQFTQMGADPEAARHTVFYSYFPAQAMGMAAADALRAEGFAVTVGPLPEDFLRGHPDAPNPWCVVAEEFGGQYDGWECDLTEAEAAAYEEQRP